MYLIILLIVLGSPAKLIQILIAISNLFQKG